MPLNKRTFLIGSSKYILVLIVSIVLIELIFNFEIMSSNIYLALIKDKIFIDPYLDFIKAILFSIFISLFFIRQRIYFFLWFIKLFITLFIMTLYEYKYGLDSFTYFHRAVNFDLNVIYGSWGESSGSSNMMIFVHYLTYIFGESYYTIKVFFSFIGFTALIIFHNVYKYIMNMNGITIFNNKFAYLLFLFPSNLFWSSTLGKDPLNLFFVSIFVFYFIKLREGIEIKGLLLIAFSLLGMFYLRSWWVGIMLLSAGMYSFFYPNKRLIALFILTSPFLLYMADYLLDGRGINDIFVEMTYLSKVLSEDGSAIEPVHISSFLDYFTQYIPSVFTAIYRPMVWDVHNVFTLIAAIENTLLLYFTFKYVSFLLFLRIKYVQYLVFLIVSWSIPYSILSSANLGTGARFKLQILPAILIIIAVSYYEKHSAASGRFKK